MKDTRALLQAGAKLLVRDQAVENRQDLFPIGIHTVEVIPEGSLEVPRFHPLIHHGAGDVDILPQGLDIMAAEEKSVEKGSLSLWR
jgi:hypothetical protein